MGLICPNIEMIQKKIKKVKKFINITFTLLGVFLFLQILYFHNYLTLYIPAWPGMIKSASCKTFWRDSCNFSGSEAYWSFSG